MPTDFASTLDIRDTTPLKRQQLMLGRLEMLQQGQSFQLVADHDPKNLRELLQARSGDVFAWDCLEAGPAVWRVQIGKIAVASGNCCSGGACCG